MSETLKRPRSPNYPSISLPEALQQLRHLFDRIQKYKAPKELVIKAIGYSGLNGASASAISAHTKYGILDRLEGDEFKISDLGMKLLFHENPAEYAAALHQAARSPALFSELMAEFPSGIPHDDILRTRLIRRGFAQSAVATAISSYRETVEFVVNNSGGYSPLDETAMEEPMQPQQAHQAPPSTPVLVKGFTPTLPVGAREEVPSSREERILDDDGNAIIVKFPGEPTVETYEFLKDYLEFRIQRLSRAAKKAIESGES
jgi:hypothetical protein